MNIASISKLKEKSNYKEWHNFIQGFCQMNKYWQYMLKQIFKLTPFKKIILVIQKVFNTKLMK